jgi:hypothetical protein
MNFVVFEQLFHKKYPSSDKKYQLQRENQNKKKRKIKINESNHLTSEKNTIKESVRNDIFIGFSLLISFSASLFI